MNGRQHDKSANREDWRTERRSPYTQEFETLYAQFIAQSGQSLGRHEVWRALVAQRKAGRLVRKCRPG
ncbi:MAG: hypothetical protein ACK4PI_11925 [Tepidisphaerales bacterium]